MLDHLLFKIFAFIFGATVGSFLNVVIYRLPLNLSVNNPRRSFCPHCKKQIPFYHNLPILSWLLLRGRCAYCKSPISPRYLLVEFLTGLLFLLAWNLVLEKASLSLLLPYWILIGLLLSATFIDFDHYIIPDEITLGGTAAGLLLSFLFPAMMEETVHWKGLLWSLAGAAAGFALLWFVVEAGRLAFGRIKREFDPPLRFNWVRKGDDADLQVGEERLQWSEIFDRESARLVMQAEGIEINGQPAQGKDPYFFYDRMVFNGQEYLLDQTDTISGTVRKLTIPREAMGFGDVKFIACIGAFLGWKAVLFTIVASSIIGSLVGIGLLLAGKRDSSGRIPFGPYLALGALLWIFAGPQLVDWYWGLMQPPPPVL